VYIESCIASPPEFANPPFPQPQCSPTLPTYQLDATSAGDAIVAWVRVMNNL
jgi:hypothetical protein